MTLGMTADLIAEPSNYETAYYWARHPEGWAFIVYYDDGKWFCHGIDHPIDFDESWLSHRIWEPNH